MKSARKGLLTLGAIAAAGLAFNANAQEVWSDNFDSYVSGSSIHGQGGWSSWGGDPTWESFVSSDFARSGANSIKVEGDSDTVYWFQDNGIDPNCGQWTLTAYAYVPDSLVGVNDTYFIVLDRYDHAGTDNHWGTQDHWDPDTDTIIADFDLETLPTIYNEWVELRLEVDLENDLQEFYYGGDLLYSDTWTANINSGGSLLISAIDLFAYGATPVYYDDISLVYNGGCVEPPCLNLDLDRLVAGLPSTWTVSGLVEGQKAAIAWGLRAGQSRGSAFGYCYDFEIAGINSTDRLLAQVTGDANGEATYMRNIPNYQGLEVHFQAAAQVCPDPCMSNVVIETIQ